MTCAVSDTHNNTHNTHHTHKHEAHHTAQYPTPHKHLSAHVSIDAALGGAGVAVVAGSLQITVLATLSVRLAHADLALLACGDSERCRR